jgi:hypothetical protein
LLVLLRYNGESTFRALCQWRRVDVLSYPG